MSKYLEDIQGKVVSNPINETNTKYAFNEKSDDGKYHNDNYPLDTQYMYNYNEPVSDFDTAYYDDYRNKVEELRKKTESTYDALESCIVPVEIPGMSFQPYEFQTSEGEYGEVIKEKLKSFTYFFQDHLSPISQDTKEFVFRTNKVKFKDDRHRRLIYDRTIHIMTLKEDEDNKVSFIKMIYRTLCGCDYVDSSPAFSSINQIDSLVHFFDVRDLNSNKINLSEIFDYIKNNNNITVLDDDGNEVPFTKNTLICKSGQDIDTGIPSTLYNLYNMGLIEPSVIFLNGLIIPWTKIIFSVDSIDTFIIISSLPTAMLELLDDNKEIYLDYVHIPFKVGYVIGTESLLSIKAIEKSEYSTSLIGYKKYYDFDVIFIIDKNGGTRFQSLSSSIDFSRDQLSSNNYDRIVCLDPYIKYTEFTLDTDVTNIGIKYSQSFKTFCDNDYRCKLKRFNFLGFELDRYEEDNVNNRATFKNDDFDIIWHPFNIIDIRMQNINNRRRVFKVFYNTRVLYDQDNVLRIKNHDYLSDEYERYRKDLNANIEVYLNEIYIMTKKDIGTYIATQGKMKGYKYHYVSPYECFMLYNAIQKSVYNDSTVSLDEFLTLNTITDSLYTVDDTKFQVLTNPELIANSEGDCVWVIPFPNQQYSIHPTVNITKISDGEKVLSDITFDEDNKNVIISMTRNGNNIAEGIYRVLIYYSDYVKSNVELKTNGKQCVWELAITSEDVSEDINIDDISIDVYNAETNQIIVTDITKDNTNNTITIYINSEVDIPANQYIAALSLKETKKGYVNNYLKGGFVVISDDVMIDEETEQDIFMNMIKEKDIYEDGDKSTTVKDSIITYFQNIVTKTGASICEILMPISNEFTSDGKPASTNYFYSYEGDSRGKVVPYNTLSTEFGLEQELNTTYDQLKIRFELNYLNNMEEGATPVDEFIYYFDNNYDGTLRINNTSTYPVVNEATLEERKTAITLDALADIVFQYDPHSIIETIKKLNWSADYIIPDISDMGDNINRDNCITCINSTDSTYNSTTGFTSINGYTYKLDPYYFYNFGYYDEDNNPHKLASEWGLRRNLPEMFIFALDEDEYTIDSMHLLDEVFDFTYDFNKTYEENLKEGTDYIIGYDADKLEQSIKRSIVSITKTGKELKTLLDSNEGYVKNLSLGGYKLVTFVKNGNQKIAFNNITITVHVYDTLSGEKNLIKKITYIAEDGSEKEFEYVNMKHNSQTNYTIKKEMYSFTDIDKSFTQQYDSWYYNSETDTVDFYLKDELVVVVQVDKVKIYSFVEMSRWNIGQQDNYVMVFKNRELYKYYYTIDYTDISFAMHLDAADDDQFEFVFFLNANNTVMKKICNTTDDTKVTVPSAYYSLQNRSIRVDIDGNLMDKGLYETVTEDKEFECAIPCDTSVLDAENVQLLINTMPTDKDDTYSVTDNTNTTYELDYTMYSYENKVNINNGTNSDSRYFVHTLKEDNKLNGLHRVTKQGGGEYILTFDGKVPESTEPTTPGGSSEIIVNPGTGITGIGLLAFGNGSNLHTITFNGTTEQWESISKTYPWVSSVQNLSNPGVVCENGCAAVSEEETEDKTSRG